MTTVTIGYDFIEISGHAPEAVVCHGISAISQMVANCAVDKGWAKVEKKDGDLKIYNIKDQYLESDLFSAMIAGLKDIQTEYPGNIEIKYK